MYIQRISKFCEKLKEKKGFQYSVIFVIIISSLAIGVKTYTLNPALLNLLIFADAAITCLLYTSPSPRDAHESRMPSSA